MYPNNISMSNVFGYNFRIMNKYLLGFLFVFSYLFLHNQSIREVRRRFHSPAKTVSGPTVSPEQLPKARRHPQQPKIPSTLARSVLFSVCGLTELLSGAVLHHDGNSLNKPDTLPSCESCQKVRRCALLNTQGSSALKHRGFW